MTKITFASLLVAGFGAVSVGLHGFHAVVEGRPTVRANAAFGVTALVGKPEPDKLSRPFGRPSTFAKGGQ